jgi:hypothetical protein
MLCVSRKAPPRQHNLFRKLLMRIAAEEPTTVGHLAASGDTGARNVFGETPNITRGDAYAPQKNRRATAVVIPASMAWRESTEVTRTRFRTIGMARQRLLCVAVLEIVDILFRELRIGAAQAVLQIG